MSDDLPTEYDVIVFGTGMVESIFAAACARIGQRVLHMDKKLYYGSDWATFNFDGMQDFLCNYEANSTAASDNADFNEFLLPGETAVPCQHLAKTIHDAKQSWFIPDMLPTEDLSVKVEKVTIGQDTVVETEMPQENVLEKDEKINELPECSENKSESGGQVPFKESTEMEIPEQWSIQKMKSLSRKFNLDLSPKLLYARGELVELLISSNVARYAEFKSVTRVLTHLDGQLHQVPCSRSDVFSTKHVSVVEKRMLMKLLTFCIDFEQHPEEHQGYETKSFQEYLKSRKLTDNVQHYVMNGIAMVPVSASTLEGLQAVQVFLKSLGRFGNTPFLWPLYGSGELPQCFCRLCAVFGGIYCLKRGADALILDSKNQCSGIITNGKRLTCKWLVMEIGQVPQRFLPENYGECQVSRCILITDKTMLSADKEQLTFLRLPAGNGILSPVWIIELGSGAMACPNNLYVVHLTCKMVNASPEEDLASAVALLFNTEDETIEGKPKILWSAHFRIVDSKDCDFHTCMPNNILATLGPGNCIDFDEAVQNARHLFEKAFPEEQFLPRAPDPEDIVIEDSEPNPNNDSTEKSE